MEHEREDEVDEEHIHRTKTAGTAKFHKARRRRIQKGTNSMRMTLRNNPSSTKDGNIGSTFRKKGPPSTHARRWNTMSSTVIMKSTSYTARVHNLYCKRKAPIKYHENARNCASAHR